jgi:hypothetical protein
MIKRYDYGLVTTSIGEWYDLKENPDGDLVMYEDHKEAMDDAQKAFTRLALDYLTLHDQYSMLKDWYDELDYEMKGLQK